MLDDAIEGILVRGLKLFSLWPKGLLNEILSDLGWRPESAPLNDQNLFRLFESELFLQICGVGAFILMAKTTELVK